MNLGSIFSRPRRPRPPRPQTIISRQIGKAIAALILAGGAALFGLNKSKDASNSNQQKASISQQVQVANSDENFAVINAINQQKELLFAEIKNAKVVKLLRNDSKGSRHQRWIVQLSNGASIRIVHNIDLAEKVPLSAGDTEDAAGELVYNDRTKEPTLHWTHADPRKKRAAGYIKHLGKSYGELL